MEEFIYKWSFRLQACKFVQNELCQRYFSRILLTLLRNFSLYFKMQQQLFLVTYIMAAFKHKRFYLVGPTSKYIQKVSNRSMNNVLSLFKVCYKDNKIDLFVVSLEHISHQICRIKITFGELLIQIIFKKTVQSISTKINYALSFKILQGARHSQWDCYSKKVFQNFWLKSQINTITKSFCKFISFINFNNFFADIFQ